VRKQERTGESVTISAADPLNMVGILLPGSRVPALLTNVISYVDGVPEDAASAFA
jgi:ATP-dependent Lhr-like helicase